MSLVLPYCLLTFFVFSAGAWINLQYELHWQKMDLALAEQIVRSHCNFSAKRVLEAEKFMLAHADLLLAEFDELMNVPNHKLDNEQLANFIWLLRLPSPYLGLDLGERRQSRIYATHAHQLALWAWEQTLVGCWSKANEHFFEALLTFDKIASNDVRWQSRKLLLQVWTTLHEYNRDERLPSRQHELLKDWRMSVLEQ